MTANNQHFPIIPRLIATSFGCGYWPWGPGTMGAIGGVAVWFVALFFCQTALSLLITTLVLIIIFTILGVWSASIAENYWGPDPSRVVMDETVGQWINMLPLAIFAGKPDVWSNSAMWVATAASLILFRFFDIVKPMGVRACEKLPRGYGIMADDILAGIYGAIILQILLMLI